MHPSGRRGILNLEQGGIMDREADAAKGTDGTPEGGHYMAGEALAHGMAIGLVLAAWPLVELTARAVSWFCDADGVCF